MRNHVISYIEKKAEQDKNLIILTGDLGYSVLDRFNEKFPGRMINCGIAEQNMACIGAGLALTGKTVIIYSIGNFVTLRCIEQIRNSICYHNANVKIISIGAGFAYGQLGMSHHATEDVSMMRALPNMRIYSPACPSDAQSSIQEALDKDGPCYIRLERNGETELDFLGKTFENGILTVKEGKEIAIFSTGSIINEAILASNECNDIGIYDCVVLKPFNEKFFNEICKKYKYIISLEEHNVIGGLNSILSECIVNSKIDVDLHSFGLKDEYTSIVGSQKYLRKIYKIDSSNLTQKIKELKSDV